MGAFPDILGLAIPAAAAALAVFFFLAAVLFRRLTRVLLEDLRREVERKLAEQEELRKAGKDAPLLAKYRRVEADLRRLEG